MRNIKYILMTLVLVVALAIAYGVPGTVGAEKVRKWEYKVASYLMPLYGDWPMARSSSHISVSDLPNLLKSHGKEKEKLFFPSRAAASTPPQSVIDQSTGQVEEVICDDNYRLSQAQK